QGRRHPREREAHHHGRPGAIRNRERRGVPAPGRCELRAGRCGRRRGDPAHDFVRPTVELLDSSALTGRLMRSANWLVWTLTGPKPIVPPKPIINDIAARPTWEGIPYLRDVTETP